jgi:ligand-binding sensor domain-containing protein
LIGTYSYGFYIYNPINKSFKNFTVNQDDPKCLNNNTTRKIYEDKSGIIWICSDNGLNKFDRASNEFIKFYNDPANPYSLSSNIILNIFEDKDRVMWISTNKGLSKFDKYNRFVNYSEDDDLLVMNSI